jgi:hypothetical protein
VEPLLNANKVCHQNAGQNHNIKIANKSSQNVAKLKYLKIQTENFRERSYLETWTKTRNNIKVELEETGCEDEDWIQTVQDVVQWQSIMTKVLNLSVP